MLLLITNSVLLKKVTDTMCDSSYKKIIFTIAKYKKIEESLFNKNQAFNH